MPIIRLASLARDLQQENEGATVASTRWGSDVTYTVRSDEYAPFVQARTAALERHRRLNGTAPLATAAFVDLFGRLVSDHLLLGWSGFDVLWTPVIATATLVNPAYMDVLSDVLSAAAGVGKGRVEYLEDVGKNSDSASVGS